jgi:hypothetical protein
MRRAFFLPLLAVGFATAATAQTIEIRTNQQSAFAAQLEPVRVNVGVNAFVPLPTDDAEQSARAQEIGRKMVYDMAARECGLLREVLASDCRLESVNVNIQRANQFGNQVRIDGFNINGNIGFRIVPKAQ